MPDSEDLTPDFRHERAQRLAEIEMEDRANIRSALERGTPEQEILERAIEHTGFHFYNKTRDPEAYVRRLIEEEQRAYRDLKEGTNTITPSEYVLQNYQQSDRLAVLILNRESGEKHQLIRTAEAIAGEKFQGWLRHKNAKGAEIYISQNALRESAEGRKKEDVLWVRHVYLDLDRDGDRSLAAIRSSQALPEPNFVINTSPGKFQVIWKVEGMTPDQAESLQRALVREFGGDPAATDSTRVLRLPGFYNKKYQPSYRIEARPGSSLTYHLGDFKLLQEQAQVPTRGQAQHRSREQGERHTPSDHDWQWVKRRLHEGQSPEVLIQKLIEYRDDKPDPEYYARRTVTRAYARVALARGDDPDQVARVISAYPPHANQNGDQYARDTVREAVEEAAGKSKRHDTSNAEKRHTGHRLGLRITP